MAENFPKLGKEMDIQTQQTQQTPTIMNPRNHTETH